MLSNHRLDKIKSRTVTLTVSWRYWIRCICCIYAQEIRVATQMDQRLTDCSGMFWLKLLLCICGRGDKINIEVRINTYVVLLLLYYLWITAPCWDRGRRHRKLCVAASIEITGRSVVRIWSTVGVIVGGILDIWKRREGEGTRRHGGEGQDDVCHCLLLEPTISLSPKQGHILHTSTQPCSTQRTPPWK